LLLQQVPAPTIGVGPSGTQLPPTGAPLDTLGWSGTLGCTSGAAGLGMLNGRFGSIAAGAGRAGA
jgi:hypothetical protein